MFLSQTSLQQLFKLEWNMHDVNVAYGCRCKPDCLNKYITQNAECSNCVRASEQRAVAPRLNSVGLKILYVRTKSYVPVMII
jgi:hypothetical protein